MQFTQPAFFLFIACFFLGWHWLEARSPLRLAYGVLASFVFYSWGDWRQLLVLVAAGLIGFWGAIGIENHPRIKKIILAAALTASLGLLFAFKYSSFVFTNLQALGALVGILPSSKVGFSAGAGSGWATFAPLGLSFYILQTLSYLLDTYAGRLQPTHSITHFFAYLALFPKLLAGPIERGKDLLPQLAADFTPPTEAQRWEGTKWIVWGYALKAVIADNLAPYVDLAFNSPAVRPEAWFWWLAVTAFAFQLYCDFRGYSAIAIGLGRWMGYRLSDNFNHPYLATSLGEFWGRWHITLSNWLKDYIFFPLGRSRLGRGHPHLNMWLTMLASGLWHGAAWQFIFWGGLHGLYISLERLTQWPNRLKRLSGGAFLATALVILQVWVGWVFFRAVNLPQAFQILRAMFSFQGGQPPTIELPIGIFLLLAMMIEWAALLHRPDFSRIPVPLRVTAEVLAISLLMAAVLLLRGPGSQFIYFQF
jgi:D-alanyl-lipoteichoic acid acyltransferase DltB (MBOAT superfamily)